MKTVFYENLGKIIQKIRRQRGISQSELAKRIGKGSSTYVNLIESGKRKVSVLSLTKIAKALESPLNVFFEQDYKSLDSNALLEVALISDLDLDSRDKVTILDFIEFLRSKRKENRKKL